MRTLLLFFVVAGSVGVVGCDKGDPAKGDPTPKNAGSATTIASAATNVAPPASAAVALSADATGALAGSWKVAKAPNEKAAVTLVVGDQNIALAALDATTDDAPTSAVACSMKNVGATSKLECGGTPHYNFYTAKITGGELVVTKTDGVDQDPGSEKVTEVLKKTTNATTLKLTGPASPALYGNCRPGFVQKGPDEPCMRQCLKGTECKGKDTCQMVSVKGTDGDHKVHACVPPK